MGVGAGLYMYDVVVKEFIFAISSNLRPLRLGEERRTKKEERRRRKKPQGKNIMDCTIP